MFRLSALAALAILAPASTVASAAGTTRCPGTFYTHAAPGGLSYKITNLAVVNTTCTVGKKVSRKIPSYRVLRTLHTDRFTCKATRYYDQPTIPTAGGHDSYVCRHGNKVLMWDLEIPSEL
jgi:hypothetical protein